MKKAMWTLKELRRNDNNLTKIDDVWVPARPLNYAPNGGWCSFFDRLAYAWYVVTGKHETFEWPEGQ